jgi:serine/threonine protein kinase
LSLAVLEQAELIHGDLSPNNVVIDLGAGPGTPALYLIDFDAFVAPAAGANRAVTVAEGGTYGTDGYCPPDLATAASDGDGAAAPFSDRYGRDMLLLELLLMGSGRSADDPLANWNREQVRQQFAAWQARSDPRRVRALCHLDPALVFRLGESERPASVDLVIGLGLALPQRRVLKRVTELSRPAPAILGSQLAIVETDGTCRKPNQPQLGYGRRKTRMRRTPQPFYRPQKAKPGVGDQDLAIFIAIVIGFLSAFLWVAIMSAFTD